MLTFNVSALASPLSQHDQSINQLSLPKHPAGSVTPGCESDSCCALFYSAFAISDRGCAAVDRFRVRNCGAAPRYPLTVSLTMSPTENNWWTCESVADELSNKLKPVDAGCWMHHARCTARLSHAFVGWTIFPNARSKGESSCIASAGLGTLEPYLKQFYRSQLHFECVVTYFDVVGILTLIIIPLMMVLTWLWL